MKFWQIFSFLVFLVLVAWAAGIWVAEKAQTKCTAVEQTLGDECEGEK